MNSCICIFVLFYVIVLSYGIVGITINTQKTNILWRLMYFFWELFLILESVIKKPYKMSLGSKLSMANKKTILAGYMFTKYRNLFLELSNKFTKKTFFKCRRDQVFRIFEPISFNTTGQHRFPLSLVFNAKY